MEKFIILKLDKPFQQFYDIGIILIESDPHNLYWILSILQYGYKINTAEEFKKLIDANEGYGGNDVQDYELDVDPQDNIMYIYSGLARLDFDYANLNNTLSPANLCKQGVLQYYYKIATQNLYEICLSLDAYNDDTSQYAVLYEDANDWVYLQGFETEGQARDFVVNN